MNSLYNLALRQCSSIQSDLSRLETSLSSSSGTMGGVSSLQGQLTASLAALSRTVDDYENLAKRELNAAKREKAMQRVRKFRDDEKEFLDGLRRLKSRAANPSNGASTSSAALGPNSDSPYQLHARTPTAAHAAVDLGSVSNGSNANGYGYDRPDPLSAYRMNASAQAMFGDGGGGMSSREAHALKEHSFLSSTEAQLDSFIAQGQAIWGNVREQRDILKGTQRKLRDAAVTMGLSRDVIGYIERRSTQDNILFALGAIFTLVCFFYIYKWFG